MGNQKRQFSCQDPLNSTKASAFRELFVSVSCYPFSLICFGATDYRQSIMLALLPETPLSAGVRPPPSLHHGSSARLCAIVLATCGEEQVRPIRQGCPISPLCLHHGRDLQQRRRRGALRGGRHGP